MKNKEKFLMILGPTAVGKTNLSIDLAKKFNGEIISCDSMQIYKEMNIGTAKIKENEMKGIPHYLIDIVKPDEEFTVSDYSRLAKEKILEINSRNKLPILVGGTGLYINSLIYELSFTEVKPNYKIRNKYENLAAEKGRKYVHKLLREIDEESADKLHPNDLRRVVRAIEIFEMTGEKMSDQNKNFREPNKDYNSYILGLRMDRSKLYERINHRVDLMVEEGLIDEVKYLLNKDYDKDLVSMQAIGYKEIIDYLEGSISYEESMVILKRNSRRYAKRQLTWFRKEDRVNWVDVEDYNIENIYKGIEEKLF